MLNMTKGSSKKYVPFPPMMATLFVGVVSCRNSPPFMSSILLPKYDTSSSIKKYFFLCRKIIFKAERVTLQKS